MNARSFGVFTVSYKPGVAQARGGIAGTAFFVSKTRAITAYHVLKRVSFKPAPGFDHAKVWLVHENHAPIELNEKNLHYYPDRDETVIDFDRVAVEDAFVFQPGGVVAAAGANVETEGFLANSAGPVLQFAGEDLRITSVPQLHRLHMTGGLTRSVRVNIEAVDLSLKETPCLELDYIPVVGMSGGPVLENGRVIGMNSFADPTTRAHTWAVALPQ